MRKECSLCSVSFTCGRPSKFVAMLFIVFVSFLVGSLCDELCVSTNSWKYTDIDSPTVPSFVVDKDGVQAKNCVCGDVNVVDELKYKRPYLGEIMTTIAASCPYGWAMADGSMLEVSKYPKLFEIIGGDESAARFALPDMRGRVAMGAGTAPGLTKRVLGERVGTEQETLSVAQLPSHDHIMGASSNPADVSTPSSNTVLAAGVEIYTVDPSSSVSASLGSTTSRGGSAAHNNMQPSLALTHCIFVGIADEGQI